jgi:hypothetical protein
MSNSGIVEICTAGLQQRYLGNTAGKQRKYSVDVNRRDMQKIDSADTAAIKEEQLECSGGTVGIQQRYSRNMAEIKQRYRRIYRRDTAK